MRNSLPGPGEKHRWFLAQAGATFTGQDGLSGIAGLQTVPIDTVASCSQHTNST